jgi:hypothetical protein
MMNTFSRHQFGALILFACFLNRLGMALFRVKLYTFNKSVLLNTANGHFDYSFSWSATATWSLMILTALTIIGLWLLLMPARKKLPPKIQSQTNPD